jgi:ornithine cyclodeaminase
MMAAPLFVTDSQARELMTMDDAITVLRATYTAAASAPVGVLPRAHLSLDGRILHSVGGALPTAGVAGTKTWLYTPNGASPLITLFSLDDGTVIGLIEAFSLGQLRTAATSGLATDRLAPAEASRMALIGTGRQALSQAEAVACVRPLRQIALFGRDAHRRAALADALGKRLGVAVSEHDEIAAAVNGAEIVTLITRAERPIVGPELIAPGVHVNAVGAITPDRSELSAAAVSCFDLIAVDSLPKRAPMPASCVRPRATVRSTGMPCESSPRCWPANRVSADVLTARCSRRSASASRTSRWDMSSSVAPPQSPPDRKEPHHDHPPAAARYVRARRGRVPAAAARDPPGRRARRRDRTAVGWAVPRLAAHRRRAPGARR